MADTGDRRAIGKGNSSTRKLQLERKAQGICSYCGVVPVTGRVVCFSCTDRQQLRNLRSMLRKFAPRYAEQIIAQYGLTNDDDNYLLRKLGKA